MFDSEEWAEFLELQYAFLGDTPERWFLLNAVLRRQVVSYWFIDLLNGAMEATMARGRGKAKTGSEKAKAQWTTFVDIPLPADRVDEMLEMYASPETLYDQLQELLGAGYRLSFSYNPSTDAVICSVTCKDEGSPNFNCTFTSFSDNWVDALRVALFKHYVLAGGEWAGDGASVERPRFG